MVKAVASFLSSAFALLAIALFALWFLGRLCNDRWHATQYLYWLPTPFVALAIAASALCASFAARYAHMPPSFKPLRRTAMLSLFLTLLYLCGEWHALRWAASLFAPAQTPAALRVLAWNPATDFMDDFAQRVIAQNPQILAITNRPGRTQWAALQDQVGGARSMARFMHLSLVSKYRILRWGGTSLNVTGAVKRTFMWYKGGEINQDQGEALFVEVDATSDFGHPLIIWMIDMPSDPQLCRDTEFAQAAATITSFRGPTYTRSEVNLDVEDPPASAAVGFPTPDLVLGDFNTPRGSQSMRRLVGPMRQAYDEVGYGWCPSWHRRLPLIAIDQAFVSDRLKIERYRILDLGAGGHRTQVLDVSPMPK